MLSASRYNPLLSDPCSKAVPLLIGLPLATHLFDIAPKSRQLTPRIRAPRARWFRFHRAHHGTPKMSACSCISVSLTVRTRLSRRQAYAGSFTIASIHRRLIQWFERRPRQMTFLVEAREPTISHARRRASTSVESGKCAARNRRAVIRTVLARFRWLAVDNYRVGREATDGRTGHAIQPSSAKWLSATKLIATVVSNPAARARYRCPY